MFGHVDAGSITSLRRASGQLKRQYAEIIECIENKDKIAGELWDMVPETFQSRTEWPKPSSVKFCPAMDSNKKQIGTSGIYDVYLSHPDVPIIYRQPFVLETDNVRSF